MANHKHDFCTIGDCGAPHKARGLCNPHYLEAMREGQFSPKPQRKNQSNDGLTCAWEENNCDRPARKKGYCNSHYTWHHKNTPRPNDKGCKIIGCSNPHRGRGYCATHYTQLYQRDREALMSEEDNFDYEDFWLFVKQELKL
jgi:hypothetical protein